MNPTAARWAREPLVQFALVTALAFGLHAARRTPAEFARPASSPPRPDRHIEVTADDVRGVRQELTRRNARPATDAEVRDEVRRSIDEEVLYREALALGLDRGDLVVRRRLVQKMEFAVTDDARIDAGDAVLRGWLASHPDRYRSPATVTFTHVFLARDRHGADTARAATAALAALRGGADPAAVGDPFPLGARFVGSTPDDLDGRLGDGFFQVLAALPQDAWSGPVPSRYGLHLVRVTARTPSAMPSLDAVRARVREDYLDDRHAAANRAALDRLRGRYTVVVRGLDADGGAP